MNTRIRVAALAVVAAVGACSDDTGVLVEVYGDEIPVVVAKLDTMVFVDDGRGPPTDAAWGEAERIAAEGVSGWPYKVMLRPDGVGSEELLYVSALAYDEQGAIVGWGQIDFPVSFTPDLVKRVELRLHPALLNEAGCVVKDGIVVIRETDDCDLDGSPYTEDCNDLDPNIVLDLDGDPVVCFGDCAPTDPLVYPGAVEECNGIDDDCDPDNGPDPLFCANVIREGDFIVDCRIGQRVCDEGAIDPGYGSCLASPIDANGNAGVCSRWASCNESGAVDLACYLDLIARCRVPVDQETGRGCTPAIEQLHDFLQVTDCTWQLIGNIQQGSWNIGLRATGTNDPLGTFVPRCDADFVVEQHDILPRVVVLQASGTFESALIGVVLRPELVECDPDAPPHDLDCSVELP